MALIVRLGEGITTYKQSTKLLESFRKPNSYGVKRILDVIQYVMKFILNLSDVSAPLFTLLQQDVEWHRDTPQQERFDRMKQLVSSTLIPNIYEVHKPVIISGDADLRQCVSVYEVQLDVKNLSHIGS